MTDRIITVSPQVNPGLHTELGAFGALAWLWMQSASHRDIPLFGLQMRLLPSVKTQQYVLLMAGPSPVACATWARFDEAREAIYLREPQSLSPWGDWLSGERIWVTDFVAPFGHAMALSKALRHEVFPDRIGRSLYHRGDEKGLRVLTLRGARVSEDQVRVWEAANPVRDGR